MNTAVLVILYTGTAVTTVGAIGLLLSAGNHIPCGGETRPVRFAMNREFYSRVALGFCLATIAIAFVFMTGLHLGKTSYAELPGYVVGATCCFVVALFFRCCSRVMRKGAIQSCRGEGS